MDSSFIRYNNNLYYSENELLVRGWTIDLIKALLNQPDEVIENSPLFLLVRVLDQEKNKQFKDLKKDTKVLSNNKFKQIKKDEQKSLIKEALAINSYKDFFPNARSLPRNIKIILGPTNSGKTHEALDHLMNSESGAYLAPLRLLALEKYEEINEKIGEGSCNLLTGEEQKTFDNASFISQTIETFDVNKFNDTVIIDEVQMLFDESRGWAWTRAIFGAYCNNLYLIGSENSLKMLEKVFKHLGESYEVIYKNRLQPLKIGRSYNNNILSIPKQSALICFSRKSVLIYKDILEKSNKKVSIIYGALSPEVRKKQAELFCSGQTDILISTDAIGMGLNLTIKEIIFSEVKKFDGQVSRPLSSPEVKQISGRAGRFGIHDQGYVSALNSNQLSFIEHQLNQEYVYEHKIYIFPSLDQILLLASVLNTQSMEILLQYFSENCIDPSKSIFSKNSYEQVLIIAKTLDGYFPKMTLERKYGLLGIPVNFNAENNLYFFSLWIQNIEQGKELDISKFSSYFNDAIKLKYSLKNKSILQKIEDCQKAIVMYKALSIKFPSNEDSNEVMRCIYNECDQMILQFLIQKKGK